MPRGSTRWPLLALRYHRQPSHWPERSYQILRKWSNKFKQDQSRKLNQIVGSFWKFQLQSGNLEFCSLSSPALSPATRSSWYLCLLYTSLRGCVPNVKTDENSSPSNHNHRQIMRPNISRRTIIYCCTLNYKTRLPWSTLVHIDCEAGGFNIM